MGPGENAWLWKGSVRKGEHRAQADALAVVCGHLLLGTGAPLGLLPWASHQVGAQGNPCYCHLFTGFCHCNVVGMIV